MTEAGREASRPALPAGLSGRLRGGDATAMSTLVESLGATVGDICQWLTGSRQAGEHAALDAFVLVWRDREQVPLRDHDLSGWVVAHALRGVANLPSISADADRASSQPAPLPASWRALPGLGRNAFVLSQWAALPDRQVAHALGVHVRQVPELVRGVREEMTRTGASPPPCPPTHPLPDDFADAVALAIGDEPEHEVSRVRSARGPALVVLLVVVAVAAAAWLHRPSPVVPDQMSTEVEQIHRACQALASDQLGDAKAIGASPLGVLVHDAGGRVMLCASAGPVVTTSDVLEAAPDGGSAGVTAAVDSAGTTVVVAGGRLPNRSQTAKLGLSGVEATVRDGYWMVIQSLPSKQLPESGPAEWVMFDQGAMPRLLLWPGAGTRQPPGTGVVQVQCGELAKNWPKAPPSVPMVTGPRGVGVLVQLGSAPQTWGLCSSAGQGAVINAATDAAVRVSTLSTIDEMRDPQALVLGGRVPPGITRITVQSPQGVLPARIEGDVWVWDAAIDSRDVALWPTQLVVQMRGSTSLSLTVPLDFHVISSSATVFATGRELVQRCSHPGLSRVLARSIAGHVVVLGAPQGQAVAQPCVARVADGNPSQPDLYDDSGSVTPSGVVLHTAGGLATSLALIFGGGRLPAGATGLIVHLPGGDVAASISQGYWAFEAAVPASELFSEVSATLVGAHPRRVQVPVR